MKSIEREDIRGAIAIMGLCILFSLLAIIPFPIKPNVYLVCVVLGALVIDHALLYITLLFGILWWLKYVPYVTPELVAIGVIGAVLYGVRKMFVRESHPALIVGAMIIAHAVFWLLFSHEGLFSWLFVIELFYNILLTLIVYEVWVWAKKIST